MPSDWKKQLKEAVFDGQTLTMYFLLCTIISVVGMPMTSPEYEWVTLGSIFGVTAIAVLLLILYSIFYEGEEEIQIEKQESLEDIVRDIKQEMDTHASDVSKNDAVFLDEVKQLLHHITYVKRSYVLSEEKELEICIQPSSQLRDITNTFFAILPENREVITEEYLPFLQKKRKQLYDTYMKEDQEETIRQFHQQASYLKEEKEYIYVQE